MGDFSALRNLQSDNLVCIKLEGGTMEKALDFLSRCPLAEVVIIQDLRFGFNAVMNREPITLNYLTRLGIPSDPSMIFRQFLRTPKLRELIMIGMHPDEIPESIGHPAIPYPPFEDLKSLILMNGDLRDPKFYYFLITHPRIETLSVTDCCDPIAISALILLGETGDEAHCQMLGITKPPDEPGPFLPCLRQLTVRVQNEDYSDRFVAYLFSLLESRSELKVVVTEDFFDCSDITIEKMRATFGSRCLVKRG